jgi:hypothetical protein
LERTAAVDLFVLTTPSPGPLLLMVANGVVAIAAAAVVVVASVTAVVVVVVVAVAGALVTVAVEEALVIVVAVADVVAFQVVAAVVAVSTRTLGRARTRSRLTINCLSSVPRRYPRAQSGNFYCRLCGILMASQVPGSNGRSSPARADLERWLVALLSSARGKRHQRERTHKGIIALFDTMITDTLRPGQVGF